MKRKILLVGGGGHCRSVADCILSADPAAVLGIVERRGATAQTVGNIPVVGCDDDLPRLLAAGWAEAAVTLGSVGDPSRRQALFRHLKELGFHLPVIADPSAVIGSDTEIGEGVFVGKRAVINTGTRIGACAIVNTGAIVEHDCSVGAFAHISPGAVLCDIAPDVPIGFPDIIAAQQARGRKVSAYTVSEDDWLDMGQMDELEKMRKRLYGRA